MFCQIDREENVRKLEKIFLFMGKYGWIQTELTCYLLKNKSNIEIKSSVQKTKRASVRFIQSPQISAGKPHLNHFSRFWNPNIVNITAQVICRLICSASNDLCWWSFIFLAFQVKYLKAAHVSFRITTWIDGGNFTLSLQSILSKNKKISNISTIILFKKAFEASSVLVFWDDDPSNSNVSPNLTEKWQWLELLVINALSTSGIPV